MAKRDLVRLLVRLFGDPQHVDRLNRNPEKTMKAAKLSPAERKLLASGDERALRAYLGRDAAKANLDRAGLADIIKTSVADIVKTSVADIVKTSIADIVKTSISRTKPTVKPKK